MDCQDIRNHLQEYLDKSTSPEITAAVETHLKTCPQCQTEFQHLKAIDAALSERPLEPVPAELAALVRNRINAFEHRRAIFNILKVAAVILIAIGLSLGVLLIPAIPITTDFISQWVDAERHPAVEGNAQMIAVELQAISGTITEFASDIWHYCVYPFNSGLGLLSPDDFGTGLFTGTLGVLLLVITTILTIGINVIVLKSPISRPSGMSLW